MPLLGMNAISSWESLYGQQSPYEALNLEKNTTKSDIKKAYYKLAREWHPDTYKGNNPEEAEEMFKKINAAYELLSDQDTRKLWDQRYSKTPKEQPKKQPKKKAKKKPTDPKIVQIRNLSDKAFREKDINKKIQLTLELLKLLEELDPTKIDIYVHLDISVAIMILQDIVEFYLKEGNTEEASKFEQLAFEKAKIFNFPPESFIDLKKKFDRLKRKYEQPTPTKQERLFDQMIKAETAASTYLQDFSYANRNTPESMEYFINKAIQAIGGIKFSDANIKNNILKGLQEIIEIYQTRNNLEKVEHYAKLGLTKSKEWNFEQFKNFFLNALIIKKPTPIHKPPQPQLAEVEALTKSLQQLHNTLRQLETAL